MDREQCAGIRDWATGEAGTFHRKGFEKQTNAPSKGFETSINMYTQRCWKTSDPTLLEEGPGLSPLLASVLYMS